MLIRFIEGYARAFKSSTLLQSNHRNDFWLKKLDGFENAGDLTVTLLHPLCVTPGRSGPLGPVPIPGLLWPLPKSAAHDLCCRGFARHRTQRGPSTGTDVCFSNEHFDIHSFKKHTYYLVYTIHNKYTNVRVGLAQRAERSCLPSFFFVTFFVSRLRKSIAVVLNANLLY